MSDDVALVRRRAGRRRDRPRRRCSSATARCCYAVAVGMLGHGPQAEDAVHDTFLIALRRIGDLRDPAAARAWLLAILGNVCRAQLRRPAPEPVADVARAARPATGRARRSTALALRDWVWTALERLSPAAARSRVVLRYFTGASSYEAIADLCGVPVGTVRSRLNAGADASSPTRCSRPPPSAHPGTARTGSWRPRRRRRDDARSSAPATARCCATSSGPT